MASLEYSLALILTIIVLSAATWTDIDRRIIPNWLTYPFAVLGAVVAVVVDWRLGLLGSLVVCGPFLLMYALGGVGGGDVKLMFGMGLFLGFSNGVEFVFLAIGVVIAHLLIWRAVMFIRKHRKCVEPNRLGVPFAPSALIAFVAMLGSRLAG